VTDDLQLRVSKLEALEDIRSLKAIYAKVCDTGYKPEGMKPLFTEDAFWGDVTGDIGQFQGRDAICEFFGGISATISWALHYMIAPKITVDDDLVNANGTWYLWQPCTVNGQAVWLAGHYKDTYRKESDGWKFSRVELSVEKLAPYEDGWAKTPFITL
jgi:hypothetical protein